MELTDVLTAELVQCGDVTGALQCMICLAGGNCPSLYISPWRTDLSQMLLRIYKIELLFSALCAWSLG